jgi:H+-transporting ATPase
MADQQAQPAPGTDNTALSEPPVPDTDPTKGLTSDEAAIRLAQYGPNAIQEKKTTLLERIIRYFWGPIPWMIEAAAILSLIVRDWTDFAIISAMLMVNACVSYWQESKAEDAIKVLQKQLAPLARVLRNGIWSTMPARDLVPGDVIAMKIGDVIPADIKLASGDYLTPAQLLSSVQ